MKEFNKYSSIGLLVAFIGKLLIFGTSIPEMGVVLGLISLIGVKEYLEKNLEIQEIKKIIEKQNIVIEKMAQEIMFCKDNISGLKMQSGLKNTFKNMGNGSAA